MQQDELTAILARLEALEAKEEIRAVIGRYPRGVDRCEPNEILNALWPDANLVTSNSAGEAKDTINKLIGEFVPSILAATHHMVGNIIIDLRGNEAYTESYCVAHHRTHPTRESNEAVIGKDHIPEGGENKVLELIVGLRYLDRLEKRDGSWRITERRLIYDWTQVGEYTGYESGGLTDVTELFGRRSPEDASHAHWARAA